MQLQGDSWSDDDLDLHGDWDSEGSRRKREAESIEGDDDVTVDSLADIQPLGDSGSDDFDLYEDWDPEDMRRKRDAEHAAVKRAVKKSKNVDPVEMFERWKKKTSGRWEAAKKEIRDKYHEWIVKKYIDFGNQLIALREKRRQQYDKVLKRFEDLLKAKKFANENKKETQVLNLAAEAPSVMPDTDVLDDQEAVDFANVPTRRRLLSVSVTPTKVRTVSPGTIDLNVAIFQQMVNHTRQLRKEALEEIRNKYNLARKKTDQKWKDYRVQLRLKFRHRINLLRKRFHAELKSLRKSNKKIVRKPVNTPVADWPAGPSRRRLLSLPGVVQPVKSEQDAGLTSDLHGDWDSEDGRWKRDAENEEGDDDATVDSLADIQLQGDSWSDDELDLHGDWDSEESRRKRDAESIEGDDDVTVDSLADIQPLGDSGSDDFDLYEDSDHEDRRRKRDAEHAAVKRAVKKSKNVDPVEMFERWKKKTSGRWEAAKKEIRDKYHEWIVKKYIDFGNELMALREKRRQQYDKVLKRFEDLLKAKKFANENKKETQVLNLAPEAPSVMTDTDVLDDQTAVDFQNVPTRRRLLSVSVTPTKVRTVSPGTLDLNVAIFQQMVNHTRQLRKEALEEIRNKYNLARKKTDQKWKDYRVQLQQKFRHRIHLLRKRFHAELKSLRKSNKKIVRKPANTPVADWPAGPSRRRLLSLTGVVQPVKSEQNAGLTSDLHGDWDSEDRRWKRDAANEEGGDNAPVDSLADMQRLGDSWSDDDLDLHGDWDSEDSRRKRDAERIEGDDDDTDNDDDDENDDDDVQVKSSIDDKKLTPYEANAILRILRTNSVSGPEDKTFISNGFHNVQGISPVQVQGLSPNAEKIVSKASNAYGGLPENAAAYTEVAHAGNANQAHPENSAANQVLSNSAYGKIHVALPESPVVDDTVASKMSNSNTVIPESPVINTVVPKTANAKRVLPEIPVANPGVSKVVNPQIVLPKTQVAAAVDTKTANPYLSLLESQIGQGSQMANTVISKTANANRVLPVSPVAHTVVIKPDAKNIILPEGQVADTVITNAANSDKVLVRSPGHPVVDTVFSKTGNANAGRLATHTLTGSEVNAESLPANTAVKKAVKKGKNVDLAEKFKRWRKKTSRYWKNINKKLQDKYHGWKMKKHREWKNKAIATQEKRRQEYAILVKQFEDSLKAKKFAKENKTGTQVLDPVQPTYSVSDSAAVADLQGAFQQQYAQVKPINMGIPVSGRVNSDTLRVAGKSLEKVVLPETLGSNLVNGMAPSVGLQGQTRFVKPSLPNSYVSQVDEQGNPIILKSEVEEPQVLQPVSYSDPSAELQNRGQNYLLKPGNSEVAAVEAPFVMTGGNGLDGQGPVHVVNFPTRRRLLSISVTPMKVRTVSPGTIDPNVAIFKQMTDHTRQLRKEAIKGVRHRYKLAREKAAKKWNDYKAYLRKKFSHRVDLLKKRYRAKLKSLQSGGKSNKKIVRKLELESPPAATWPVAGPSRRRLLSLPEEVQHVEPGQNLDPMIKGDGSADVVVVVRKTGQATNDYSNTAWDIPEADRSLQKPDCAVLLNSMTDRFTKWQADVNSKWQQTIQWKGKYMQLKQQAKKITDKAKIWKTKRLKKMRRKEKIETARCKKASNIRLRKKRLIQSRSAGNLPRPNLKTQLRNGGEGAAVRNGVRYRTRRGADSGDSSLRNPLSYVAVNQDSYLVKATNTMHQKTNDRENNVIKFDDKNQLPNPTRGINLVQNAGRSDIKQPQSRNHPNMVNKVSEQLHGVGKIYGGYLSGNDTRMHAQITTAVPKDKSSGDTWFHYFRKMPVLGDILEFFVSFFGSEDKMQDANPVHNSTNKEKNLVVETGDLKTQHRFRRNEMHVGSFDEHSEKQGGRHLLAISRQGARMNRNGKNCANRLDKLTNRLKKREMGVLNKERKNRVWKNRYRSLKEKVGVLVIKIREWKEKEMALILRREENIRLQCRKAFHQASTRLSSRRNRIGKRKRKQKRKPLADPKTSVKVQLGKQRKGAAVGNGPRSRGRRHAASREKESGYRNGSGHEAGLKSKLHIDDPSLRKAATFDGKRHQVYSISMKTDGQLHDNSYNREKNRVKPVEKSRLADHTQANPDASKVATKLAGKPKVYSMSSKEDKSENIIIAHASTTVAVSKDTSSDDTWFEYFRKLPILGDILDFFVSFFGSEERILDKIEDNHPLHLSREKEDRLNAVISDKGSSKTWQPLRQNNKQTDGLAEKMPNEHAENQVDKKPGNRRLLAASEKDDSDGQMKNRAEADIDRNRQQHIDDSVLRKADAERRRRFSGNTWSKLHNNPYDRKNNRVEHAGEENHNVVTVIDDVVRTNVIISNFDDRRYSSKKQGKDVKTNAPMTTDISQEGLVENPDTLGQFFLEIFSNVFRLFSSIFVSSEKNLAEASEKKSSQIQSGEKSLNLVSTGEGAPKTGQRLRRDETKEHNMRQLRSTKTKTKIQQDEDSADDGEKNENPNFDYEDSSKKPGPTVPPTPPFIPFVETHEKLKEYGSDGVEFDVGDPIDVFKRAHFLCNPNDVACIENGTQTMSIHTVELWKPLPRLNETVLEMIENETRATDEDVKKLGKEIHDLIKQNEEKKEIAEEDQKRRRKKRHVTDDVISPDEVNRRKLLSSSDGGHIFKRSAVVEDEIDTYAPMNIMDEDDIEDDWGPSNNDGIEVREEIQPDTDYSEWAEWQSCSVTCGSGFRSRTRTCQGQKEHCEYGNIETELCELSAC